MRDEGLSNVIQGQSEKINPSFALKKEEEEERRRRKGALKESVATRWLQVMSAPKSIYIPCCCRSTTPFKEDYYRTTPPLTLPPSLVENLWTFDLYTFNILPLSFTRSNFYVSSLSPLTQLWFTLDSLWSTYLNQTDTSDEATVLLTSMPFF